ncbi:M60 family metallopeptidase, partial [Candidatus Rhabdochlamydia sp. W815]
MPSENKIYESTWIEEDRANSVNRDNFVIDDREFFKNYLNRQSEYEESEYEEFSTTTHVATSNESIQRYESQFIEEKQSSDKTINLRSQDLEAYWWASYKNRQGFKEALSQFNLTPELLDKDPTAAINRSNNPNDPLYWLKRNLETYFDRENNRYFIPVTEDGGTDKIDPDYNINPKIRMAFDLYNHRTNYFSTDIFMKSGDEIAITVDALDNSQTNCFAATGTSYSSGYRKSNPMALVEHQTVIYTATRAGPLMLACINKNRDMKSWGKRIKITAVPKNETKKVPIFVFGLNSQKEWRENISQPSNSLNQLMMMNGRHKIYISGDVAKKLPLNVGKLLSEYLLISTTYDKLNGFDSSKALHFPTQNLQVITFELCGFISNSLVALCNNPKTRNISRTEYVDWHELGHTHTMGWSWGTEVEVTVNIYEMVAEGLFKGKKDKFQGYDLSDRARFKLDDPKYGNNRLWDPKSVPNFINAKVDSSVLFGGFDAMSSKSLDYRDLKNRKPAHVDNESIRLLMFLQLLFSYGDDFYAKLGKAYREAWNYGDSGNLFDTNQKDKDWFVLNASRASGRDLREFFDLWG